MKKMKIEKQLLFADRVKEVTQLQVRDGLSYHREQEGIRAIGPLYIEGVYVNEEGEKQQFQETLEMDVLAPSHKLSGDDFHLSVDTFEAKPSEDGITTVIMMEIQGLVEDGGEQQKREETRVPVQEPIPQEIEMPKEEEAVTAVPVPIPQPQHSVSAIEQIPAPAVVVEDGEEQPVEHQEDDAAELEDLFEDDGTTYTSYRMIVARANDTYATIAQRYEVSEPDLMRANHDKEISEKSLIILPPVTIES